MKDQTRFVSSIVEAPIELIVLCVFRGLEQVAQGGHDFHDKIWKTSAP